MNNLYTIHSGPGIQIRALRVPGGLLIITDTYEESGNGIAAGLTSTFVQMTFSEISDLLKGKDE